MELEYQLVKNPRSGSDHSFFVSAGKGADVRAVFAAMDTIGGSGSSTSEKFVKTLQRELLDLLESAQPGDVDALADTVRGKMLEMNASIEEFTRDSKHKVSGFCASFGIVTGGQMRCHWLGDCRVYLMRNERTDAGEPFIAVHRLTQDHNRLHDNVVATSEYVFLKNELQSLSRTLVSYWGTPNFDQARELLDGQDVLVDLRPDDLAVIMTDGVYLPVLRAELDLTNYRLTPERYWLEGWLSDFIRNGNYTRDGKYSRWKQILPDIMAFSADFAARKPRYHDDMAGVTVHVTGE